MAFPALTKTWQVVPNMLLQASTNNGVGIQEVVNKIKNILLYSLTASPWTVTLCSNAGVVSGVNYGTTGVTDLWAIADQTLTQSGGIITVPNDVNFASVARHSWIVLRQSAIGSGSGLEICIDCNSASSGFTLAVSPGAGFTGGSVTARPTATDEKTFVGLMVGLVNTVRRFHAWQSSDGQCNRIMMYRGGNMNEFMFLFDKAQNPVAGWTNPIIYVAIATMNGVSSAFGNLAAATSVNMRGLGGTPNFQGSFTFEAWNANAALPTTVGIGSCLNSFDNNWPVLPMGVAAAAVGNTGRLGNVFDLWHAPIGVQDGATFPDNPNARAYVKMGGLILPWTNDATVPITA